MKEDQYLQCLHFNCLKTNNTVVNQSIAIVLPIDNNQKAAIQGTYLSNKPRKATEMDGTLHTDFQKSETSRDIKKSFYII